MRELLLERIAEIRKTLGSDLFVKPNKKGRLAPPARWPLDYDFSLLPDNALLVAFEVLIQRSYRQR